MYLHSYYLKNKEKILAKSRARYARCKDAILQQRKGNHNRYKETLNGRFVIAKRMGKTRGGGTWDITYDQFLTLVDKPCFYCGGGVEKYGTGLDRIDSSIGYVFSNVRPCCRRCNQAKNNLAEGDFYAHIKRMWAHLGLKEAA